LCPTHAAPTCCRPWEQCWLGLHLRADQRTNVGSRPQRRVSPVCSSQAAAGLTTRNVTLCSHACATARMRTYQRPRRAAAGGKSARPAAEAPTQLPGRGRSAAQQQPSTVAPPRPRRAATRASRCLTPTPVRRGERPFAPPARRCLQTCSPHIAASPPSTRRACSWLRPAGAARHAGSRQTRAAMSRANSPAVGSSE
jgi:hypothetical protein